MMRSVISFEQSVSINAELATLIKSWSKGIQMYNCSCLLDTGVAISGRA